MKYEDVEKAHCLKMGIDETKEKIDYFVRLREDKTRNLEIRGSEFMKNPLVHMVKSGNLKNAICDIIINELTDNLNNFEKELEEI